MEEHCEGHCKTQNNLAILVKQLSKSPTIKFLTLKLPGKFNLQGISTGFIESFLPKLRKLQSFQLINQNFLNKTTTNNFLRNVRKLPQLHHLALECNFASRITEESVKVLMQRLSKLKNRLESLSLKFNDLYDFLGSKISQFTHLKSLQLYFSSNNFTNETAFLLTQQLRSLSDLRAFSLNIAHSRHISNVGIQIILNLSNSFPKLTSFNLSFREPKVFSEDNLVEIGHSLARFTHLKHLTIGCNKLRNTTNEGFIKFLNLIATMENLKSLALDFEYFRRIKNRGLAEIGCLSIKMPNLILFKLNLEGAKQITDKGFSKFHENILTSKTLKFLQLKFIWYFPFLN